MTGAPAEQAQVRAARVRVDQLEFHPRNVRRDLGDLRELAASIREIGVLEPLLVEDRPGRGRVLAGHRRLAAARQAGLRAVPVLLVPEVADDVAIVTMVSENRHRAALSPAEKTQAARTLRDEFGWTGAAIAKRLGVTGATVSRWLAGLDEHDPTPETTSRRQESARRSERPAAPPRVRPTDVHDVVTRWQGHAPPTLLAELRGLLKGWAP